MEKNMEFWKLVVFCILVISSCKYNNSKEVDNLSNAECKIHCPLLCINDTLFTSKIIKESGYLRFSLFSKTSRDTISLLQKNDSIYFQFKNETIGIPVKSEHKFHKWHRDTNRLFLNQYLSLGYIDVTHKNKFIRIYKYYTREDEFSQGYSVFYSLQHGILAFGYSGKVYFLEGCFDEFIADIKEHMQEEKYFFDIDTVPPLPPMPNVISDLGNK
ncbi:MAG: hypothetical protein IPN73_06170 [Saprospiraceae bacterium]|nr:hypothetical protein [Saprospiraceae bacterium]MBK8849732.1 hypothetical protein [Saprospiraceae bacterium]